MRKFLFAALFCSTTIPAAQAADPAAGAALWGECRACHSVTGPDGTVIARGGRSGPDLYGVAGRAAAGDTGYRSYSDAMQAAARAGLVWTRADFAAYLRDPEAFLRQFTGDATARTEMHTRLMRGADDIHAWLRSIAQ